MSGSTIPNDQFSSMVQEAELYEAQGLYSHAKEIYRKILSLAPDHKEALSRLAHLKVGEPRASDASRPDSSEVELSPRLALDLGVAYMGMKLYEEALGEFTKALKYSPALRTELLRHMATCLIRLDRYQDARQILEQVFSDRTLTAAEKGRVISETVGIYVEQGLADEARRVLTSVSEEQRQFVRDYDKLLADVATVEASLAVEVLVEDEQTGEVYRAEESPIVTSESPVPIMQGQTDSHARQKEPEPLRQSPRPLGKDSEAVSPDSVAHAPAAAASPPEIGADYLIEPDQQHVTETVRFACRCGNVLIVSRDSIGVTEACSECGAELTVPNPVGTRDSLTEQVVGKIVGGSRILYKIGGGGMGGVFKGHHLGLDIPVAVKILYSYLAEKDPIFIKRFIREARAAAKLQHPNVVGVMNVGFEDGLHYLVMPYVGGGSAAALLSKLQRLSLAQVLDIAMEITRALILAEEHNIMHRDIKPANILFTEKGEVKLADLGLAKSYLDSADSGITQTGIACGTPLYFSPEQAKGNPDLDIRSDIYSLGITLYHLLEGTPPFLAESAYVIFQKHVHESLPRPVKADPPVPEPVFKLLKKMTEKKPEDRFQSPRELLEALEELRESLASPAGAASKRAGLLQRLGLTRRP
ncbi:MAG: protein kinase [Deltaproteobacteria bacterium]